MKEKFFSYQSKGRVYLDWAATAIPEAAASGAGEASQVYGNPSSQHEEGRLARAALSSARQRCAAVLGVAPNTVYFTSGGTESNALALYSLLRRASAEKGRLLYSGAEHPSVRENCLVLESLGIPLGLIGVEKDGRVSEASFSAALEKYPDARLVTVMGVNNETGAITDIAALAAVLRRHQKKTGRYIHFHSDLVQAAGKVSININEWGIDSGSVSAHKLGGPRGVGLLYLKKPFAPLYSGGRQEGGVRPGTENTGGALGLADALERRAAAAGESARAGARFAYLIGKLKAMGRCRLVPEDRQEEDGRFSPWILQVRFPGIPAEAMVRALDDEGIAVSTGAACSSASRQRPALAAMGFDEAAQLEGVRISQGWSTSAGDMDTLLTGIAKALLLLR